VRFDRAEPVSSPWHDDVVTLSADFSATPDGQHGAEIQRLCDAMEAADQAGRYPQLTVERPWSVHNPVLEGEFASPKAIRWYLERELSRLAASGARISVGPGREALDLRDPSLARAVDETRWDLRRKKLFLFAPERMALSIDRLQHYTGTTAESFQRYVLLTNYSWHVEEFRAALPGCSGPDSDGRQMPAWHHMLPGRSEPLHAQPKLSADAQSFYAASRRQHVEIAISVAEKVRQLYPGGLPAADLRSADEPLLGTTDPEPTQTPSTGNLTPDRPGNI
jgi:hypothetical protein